METQCPICKRVDCLYHAFFQGKTTEEQDEEHHKTEQVWMLQHPDDDYHV